MKIERDPLWGPLVCRLEHLFFLAAKHTLMMLPEATAREVGRGLGRAAWALLRKRTHIAISNARRALGTGGARAAERSFQHFGEVIVEMVRAERLYGPKSWQKHVEFGGRANLDRALAMGKGVVCVGAHFGNWEIGGWVMSMLGYRVNAVERPLRNPLVHRELNAFRRATGQQTIEKNGAMREAIRVLKRGEILAMLADQDARRDGIFVPFLGRQASTHRAPAILSVKYGAPIVTFAVPRLSGWKYRIEFDEPFVAEETGDHERDIQEATGRYTAALERHIRRWPEQWLWMHRRWKTQPRPSGNGNGNGNGNGRG